MQFPSGSIELKLRRVVIASLVVPSKKNRTPSWNLHVSILVIVAKIPFEDTRVVGLKAFLYILEWETTCRILLLLCLDSYRCSSINGHVKETAG